MHTYTYVHTKHLIRVCVREFTHAHTHMYKPSTLFVCVCVCVYERERVYIHMHAHLYTPSNRRLQRLVSLLMFCCPELWCSYRIILMYVSHTAQYLSQMVGYILLLGGLGRNGGGSFPLPRILLFSSSCLYFLSGWSTYTSCLANLHLFKI